MYPCAKLKLDQLFLQWLSLPESQTLVSSTCRFCNAHLCCCERFPVQLPCQDITWGYSGSGSQDGSVVRLTQQPYQYLGGATCPPVSVVELLACMAARSYAPGVDGDQHVLAA